MKRKVVSHGPASLIISLPAGWVKRYNVRRGDELDVEEDGRTLRVSTGAVAEGKSISLSLEGFGPLVVRLVKDIYAQGYDEAVLSVPIVESTNTSAFVTGILWDAADDTGDGEYDAADREDLVFVTRINASQQGGYGTYDYEVRVPSMLGGYAGADGAVAIYYAAG